MGCDIHLFVELRAGETWHLVPFPSTDSNGDYTRRFVTLVREFSSDPPALDSALTLLQQSEPSGTFEYELDVSRNYHLFGWLAGVRSNRLDAIAPPRGVPQDASVLYSQCVKQWSGDGHSHSYFTLAELLTQMPFPDEVRSFAGYVQRFSTLGAPANVRIVFFFDN